MSQPYQVSRNERFEQLWAAQNGKCALCGTPMLRSRFEALHARLWTKGRATLDHITPKSKGGSDEATNLQLAHAICNKTKGDRVGSALRTRYRE